MDAIIPQVAGSLLATALTVAAGWTASLWSHRLLPTLRSRFIGMGVRYVYRRQHLAAQRIKDELTRARWVRILTGRGNELTRDTFTPVWDDPDQHIESVQILLPDTRPEAMYWLNARESDIRRIDRGLSPGLLAEQIRINSAYIRQAGTCRKAITIRHYNLPNLHRLVITDRVAFLTFYWTSQHGRNCPSIVARRPGIMYDYALTLFTTTWSHSQPDDEIDEPSEPSQRETDSDR